MHGVPVSQSSNYDIVRSVQCLHVIGFIDKKKEFPWLITFKNNKEVIQMDL